MGDGMHGLQTSVEGGARTRLTAESVYELWSKTYNVEGNPDWAHIFPYYHDDIVFQDAVQRIDGKKAFISMCRRLTKRCESLRMKILSVAESDDGFFLQWIMTMEFRRAPRSSVYGCTKLTINEHGYIVDQRDYFDLWGDIFDNIPGLRRIYRKFMRRIFG